ncbi:trypsin-like serine peptidase [Yoonia sp. R2-816]|uniref:trypsin-like serine peptidase n=1 Tax=Yoonia sp. R2-816 TaxID=3342638 RepID=UPI00372AD546
MTNALTADALRPHLAARPDLIKEALAVIYAGDARNLSMDAIAVQADLTGQDQATLLVASLEKHGTDGEFAAFLQGRGVALTSFDDLLDGLAQGPDDGAVDHADLADFATRSHAFRCRIKVGGQVMGSGALVSPRLVLTAAHVIEAALDPAIATKVEVIASDAHSYPARKVFALPCHPDEHGGALPPADQAADHLDVALLRVDPPLGRWYSHVKLPNPVSHWNGHDRFFLVHFPNGVENGLAIGDITRNDLAEIRVPHNAQADEGSSGGPGFSGNFEFLGIHQGRLGPFRRIVPYDLIAANDAFQEALKSDQPPRYLWSLDGTLDSHVVIGRGKFFDAITAMVENDPPSLRGIWVRRMDPEVTTGLSFSHDLLDQFLRASNAKYRILRVPMDLGVTDLVTHINQIAAIGDAPVAAQGVADGQTTDVAHDDDRVRRLVDRLDMAAKDADQTIWIYVDNPPTGLLAETQVQLEHFVQAVMTHPHLRLVIAGYETFGLVNALSTEVADARRMTRPNLIVEELKNVTIDDVKLSIAEMARALGLAWSPDVVAFIARRAVQGVETTLGHFFDPRHFRRISDVIRDEATRSIGQ